MVFGNPLKTRDGDIVIVTGEHKNQEKIPFLEVQLLDKYPELLDAEDVGSSTGQIKHIEQSNRIKQGDGK
ncbi:Protein of unknown function [Gryllus bimaculatus]|nr:Protein of unknown function [Gryllus bimaculatus]